MSSRHLRLSLAFVVLTWGHAAGGAPPRVDRYGDALPPGAVARLGTVRLRPGTTGTAIALSPDGKTLATGEAAVVRLWDLATGRELRACPAPDMYQFFYLAFSPDGNRLAAVGDRKGFAHREYGFRKNSVAVYDVASGKRLQLFGNKTQALVSVAFPAGGRLLAVRLSRQEVPLDDDPSGVIFWDLDTGKAVRRLPMLRCWAWRKDRKVLAGGRQDGTVRLWEAATGRELVRIKAHRHAVSALAFTPDGKAVASGAANADSTGGKKGERDKNILLWDVATGKKKRAFPGQDDPAVELTFTGDGRALISADQLMHLCVWNVTTGKMLRRLPKKIPGTRPGPESPYARPWALSADGASLFWCKPPESLPVKYNTLHHGDPTTGRELHRWKAEPALVRPLIVSPDGKHLISSPLLPRVLSVTDGRASHTFAAHEAPVWVVEFAPGGQTLASLDEDLVLRLWEASSGKPLFHANGVFRFAFAADGRSITTVGDDAVVRVWEVATGRELRHFAVGTDRTRGMWSVEVGQDFLSFRRREHAHSAAVFGSGNRVLAVAREDLAIHLWDVDAGKETRVLKGHGRAGVELALSPDCRRLVSCADDHTARLWDLASGREVRRLEGGDKSNGFFAFSPDGRLLAWGVADRIELCDAVTGKPLRSLTGHFGGIRAVLFSGDGRTLASAGGDRTIRLWDTAGGRKRRRLLVSESEYPDIALFLSPDGRLLAETSVDLRHTRFALWDVATGREIHTRTRWGEPSYALSPDGRTLAVAESAGGAGGIALREVATGALVGRLPRSHRGDIHVLAFSPDGKRLASGGGDTSILIWDWLSGSGLASAPGRKLSAAGREALWDDLAAADGRKAYQAIHALAAYGDDTVSLLKDHLPPASAKEAAAVRQWIANLDSNALMAREEASRELLRRGAEAEPLLQEALAAKPSLEKRRRIDALLAAPELTRWSSDSLRAIRAAQVLERLATPAARRLLQTWARGAPHACLTKEAKRSLQRLRVAAKGF